MISFEQTVQDHINVINNYDPEYANVINLLLKRESEIRNLAKKLAESRNLCVAHESKLLELGYVYEKN